MTAKAGSELEGEISKRAKNTENAIKKYEKARKKSLRIKSIMIFLVVVAIGSLTAYKIKEMKKAQLVAAEEKSKLTTEIGAGRVGATLGVPLVGKAVLPFAFCPAGSFTMGNLSAEDGRFDDENQVSVTLSKAFWMAKTEVNQAQWRAVMGSNPSDCKGEDLPVETVSWGEVQEFIKMVNDSGVLPSGWKMALPTEAQWEYACRTGVRAYYGGNTVQQAMYHTYSISETHAVGMRKSNAWGLYDMNCNVGEWCADWYGNKLSGGTDPSGPPSGVGRVIRGGSSDYYSGAHHHAVDRSEALPGKRLNRLGFRPALVPSE
jgi:formylglycine-generating enzyme required for sulfatase activity